SILFGILGLGYWVMYKSKYRLLKSLILIHILTTFGSLVVTYLLSVLILKENEFPLFDQTPKVLIAQLTTIFFVCLGVLLFAINILCALISGKSKTDITDK
ncbi:MAG: hypothetical protein AAF688_10535, partial [Bacteroidota bacterium]